MNDPYTWCGCTDDKRCAMHTSKSPIIHRVAKEMGVTVIDLRMARSEPGDLIGLPKPDLSIAPGKVIEVEGQSNWYVWGDKPTLTVKDRKCTCGANEGYTGCEFCS